MFSDEIRRRFLDYFEERGHTIVPSSSLIPDDPSVLLTTAGMQQFKRYFTGELDPVKDFGSKNTVSVQKSFRTSDIDEVGDESHLTFFEMLGNFSFGGYFKKEAIEYAHEFITKEMGLEIDYVSVFDPEKVPKGDWRKDVPFDEKSYNIWKEKIGLPDEKIKREGVDNFWGPTGGEGPCGPTTEIYVKGLEIWNIVFNEFYCDKDKKLAPLKTPGVDTGMGLERLAMVSQGVPTIFETDLLKSIIDMLPESLSDREKRIVADHSRGIAFIISDGVRPSNKEADYILRKLIRRVVMFEKKHVKTGELFKKIVEQYGGFYKKLDNEVIQNVFIDEYVKFTRTLRRGLNELKKEYPNLIICGDYNICHEEIDIHNPKGLKNVSGFLPVEREWIGSFIDSGFIDSFRHLNSAPHQYSWWSYRANARANNKGWRLDYAMVANPLQEKIKRAVILSDAVHSDHCPILVEIEKK